MRFIMGGEMEITVLDKADKKKSLQELAPYGIESLDYLLIHAGHRLRIFSGLLSKHELIRLMQSVHVDNLGLYFASLKEGFRLHLDAVHLLKEQLKERIVILNDNSAAQWFRGEPLDVTENLSFPKGSFVLLKNGDDFIGIGKFTGDKILNFLPKERLIR